MTVLSQLNRHEYRFWAGWVLALYPRCKRSGFRFRVSAQRATNLLSKGLGLRSRVVSMFLCVGAKAMKFRF